MADKIAELYVEIKADLTKLQNDFKQLKTDSDKAANSINTNLNKSTKDLSTSFVSAKGQIKQFGGAVLAAQGATGKFGNALSSVGQSLLQGGIVGAGFAAAAAGITYLINKTKEFSDTLNTAISKMVSFKDGFQGPQFEITTRELDSLLISINDEISALQQLGEQRGISSIGNDINNALGLYPQLTDAEIKSLKANEAVSEELTKQLNALEAQQLIYEVLAGKIQAVNDKLLEMDISKGSLNDLKKLQSLLEAKKAQVPDPLGWGKDVVKYYQDQLDAIQKNIDKISGKTKPVVTPTTTTTRSPQVSGYTAEQQANFEQNKFAVDGYVEYAMAKIDQFAEYEISKAKGNASTILAIEQQVALDKAKLKIDQVASQPVQGPSLQEYQAAMDKRAEIDNAYIASLGLTNDLAYNLSLEKLNKQYDDYLKYTENTLALDAWYASEKAKLDEANTQANKKKLDETQALEDTWNGVSSALGAVSNLMKTDTVAYKALAMVQAIIATALGVSKALPNIPLAIAVGAMGAAQIATIAGAHSGGTFLNGKKIASFAAGGDFIVPQGFPSDSFPLLAESGERVKVTPSGRVGDEARLLAGIGGKLDALNKNLAMKNMTANVSLDIDGKKLVKQVTKPVENRLRKSGLNLDAL